MSRRLIRFYLALLILTSASAWSAAQTGPAKVDAVEGIAEYVLPNGLRVLLFPDKSQPKVTVNLTVFVGSRHEGYGETGMAHLLEHMVFKGTPSHPNPPKALRDRGASFNGSTWVDRTNYFETLPASDENLEFAIRFEADRLVNSFIKREDLISEMTVVRNEFEMGENSPSNVLSERMMSAAYEWHNYGKSTIGNRSDIERVPIENLQAFYKKFYRPDNALLVIAGQFDEQKALGYVQKHFGVLPKPARKIDTTYTEEPPQDGERLVTLRRVGDVGLVGAIYHIPAGSHEDFAAVAMLARILVAQPSGRLYKALVESKKASSVSGTAYAWHDPGVLGLEAQVRRENSLEDAKSTMLATLDEVIAGGVTEAEVQRAKQEFLTARRQAAENTSQIAIQLSDWAAQGDWRLYFLHRDRVEKVTPADVKRVAGQYLQKNNRTLGLFIPTAKPERVAIPSSPDVKALLAGYKGRGGVSEGEVFDYSYATIEARTKRLRLSEDFPVAALSKKSRDEAVQLHITLRYGNAENLRSLSEAASFLPRLMTRGTKKYGYQELRDELTKQNATLIATDGAGEASFEVRTKKPNLPAVLELLRQVLREPALSATELDILKRQQLAALEQQRTDPRALAMNRMTRTSSPYPKDHVRYTPTIEEQAERVQALTIEQVRKLHGQYLNGRHGGLVIVGDFEPEPTLKTLTQILSGWDSSQPYAHIERKAFTDVQGGKQTILTPDKANAIYIGGLNLAMSDGDPDYPALALGNFILGGPGLSSRLADRVRQKEGLSYGIGSMFQARPDDKVSRLAMFAICNPGNIGKVETAIREEFERMLKSGVTKEELEQAKAAYLRSQTLSRSTDVGVATRLGNGLRQNRTMSFYAEQERAIQSLTAEELSSILRKRLDSSKLVVVTAGDFPKQ
jgi:zinc protease